MMSVVGLWAVETHTTMDAQRHQEGTQVGN
jgi:hypothetical protein